MDRLENKKIAIIGMGHMGNSLYKGLLNGGFNKQKILLSNEKAKNVIVAKEADWIILCVKPFQIKDLISEIKDVTKDKLLISAAAAVSIKTIKKFTKNETQKIVRIMPNLPVTVNQGVIGLYPNTFVNQVERREVNSLLSKLGLVVNVATEVELDVLTIISGSGPALVSYCINMFANTASSLGISKKAADVIASKTFIGTLMYLEKANLTPIELQRAVATKGGITEEIMNALEKEMICLSFENSIKKGKTKINNLQKEVIDRSNN